MNIAVPMFLQIGSRRYQVDSFKEASEKFCKARDLAEVGASEVPPVKIVTAEGDVIARISYNGRVWAPGEWKVDDVPLYDNR